MSALHLKLQSRAVTEAGVYPCATTVLCVMTVYSISKMARDYDFSHT